METLLAFHGKKSIKTKYLKRVRAHAAADNLIQGSGWENGRGCAIGCTLENYDHSRYPIELGIPESVARLEDRIFEGLPKAKAMLWPDQFLSAIKVGADLSLITPKILLWIMIDPKHGIRQYARQDGKAAIDLTCDVLTGWIKDGSPNQAAAEAAEAATRAAAEAAWAAAVAAAEAATRAAWAAAEAATRAAAWAAWAAAVAAAEAAARAAWAAAEAATRAAAWAAVAAAVAAARAAAVAAAEAAAVAAAEAAAVADYYIALSQELLSLLSEA